AVLSGNRNFEGRVHPQVRANYLASPPLVVAHALSGSLEVDLTTEPLGTGADGKPVFLRDVWPTPQEVRDMVREVVSKEMFAREYASVFEGDDNGKKVGVPGGAALRGTGGSTLRAPPAVFRGHDARAVAAARHREGAGAGEAGRLDHDRSHLTGGPQPQERS